MRVSSRASAFAQEKVLLRYAYKTGDKYDAVTTVTQDITQSVPGGQSVSGKQTSRTEISMEVLGVDADGTAELKFTHRRIVFGEESRRGRVEYDSADPAKQNVALPQVRWFKALVGRPLKVKMTARGEGRGITGVDEVVKAIVEQIPEGEEREAARKELPKAMNDERFSRQMSSMLTVLPEQAVGVGDTWTREQKAEQKMSIGTMAVLTRATYKVARITPDQIELAVESVMERAAEQPADAPVFSFEPGLKDSGTMTMSRANAVVLTSNILLNVKLTVSPPGQTIQQQTTGVVTTTIKPAGN